MFFIADCREAGTMLSKQEANQKKSTKPYKSPPYFTAITINIWPETEAVLFIGPMLSLMPN